MPSEYHIKRTFDMYAGENLTLGKLQDGRINIQGALDELKEKYSFQV